MKVSLFNFHRCIFHESQIQNLLAGLIFSEKSTMKTILGTENLNMMICRQFVVDIAFILSTIFRYSTLTQFQIFK